MNRDDLKYVLAGEKSPRMKLKGDLFELSESLYKQIENLRNKKVNKLYRLFTSKKKQEENENRYENLKNKYNQILFAYRLLDCKSIGYHISCKEGCNKEGILQ